MDIAFLVKSRRAYLPSVICCGQSIKFPPPPTLHAFFCLPLLLGSTGVPGRALTLSRSAGLSLSERLFVGLGGTGEVTDPGEGVLLESRGCSESFLTPWGP